MEGRRGGFNKMSDIKIFINSANRYDKPLVTLKQIPISWKGFCEVAVPVEQGKKYRDRNPGWNIFVFPKSVPCYLSSQRQYLLSNSKNKYVFLMDDDLSFQFRENGKLRNCTPNDMERMLSSVLKHHSDFPIVGISSRFGNNRVLEDFVDNTRVSRCYSVDTDIFKSLNITIAPFEPFIMQDFYLVLQFLTRGKTNRVLYNFSQGDGGSNTEGGVSKYRNPELMKKVADFLHEKYPHFVVVKEKKTKGSWKNFPKDKEGNSIRTDVNIFWKRAYLSSKRKNITEFFK